MPCVACACCARAVSTWRCAAGSTPAAAAGRWASAGIAATSSVWYRVLSVRSGPDHVIPRFGLEITNRRLPSTPESYAMPLDATVLRCRADTGEIELAIGAEALTGFLSWLESAPPGNIVPWAS